MEHNQLWQDFWETRDDKALNALLVHYLPLVRYVSSTLGVPHYVSFDDLTSYGVFGLRRAIERFDPSLGYKFETYAVVRIRGSIYDELRSADWVPRSVRAKARRVAKAVTELENTLMREPTPEEIAERLGVTVEELSTDLAIVSQAHLESTDRPTATHEEGTTTIGDILPSADEGFVYALESDLRARIADAIMRLPRRDQTFIMMRYLDGQSLSEIAGDLGVTDSRACQLAGRTALALRIALMEAAAA